MSSVDQWVFREKRTLKQVQKTSLIFLTVSQCIRYMRNRYHKAKESVDDGFIKFHYVPRKEVAFRKDGFIPICLKENECILKLY